MQSIVLREHQQENLDDSLKALTQRHVTAVLSILPTGAGKTFVMGQAAKLAEGNGEITLMFAHRDILLTQLSDSLCKLNVRHSFIASTKAIKNVTNANLKNYGDSYFDELSLVIIVSVDTFLRRMDSFAITSLIPKVKWWLMDEAHHLLAENKWGQCIEPLINAKGIGVTATPIRGDKKGLGRHEQGVFDELIVGTNQSELMKRGHLSLYKIYSTPVLLDISNVNITNGGDYNNKKLAEATDTHDITGDAVKHYKELCSNMQAITFCVNIAHAEHVAQQFNMSGITSVALSSKTATPVLLQALEDFKNGLIMNLVNCDLFGEGFDVPAVACVIMLRKTASYSLFKQQFGRCLRPSEGKVFGYLLDHVGNVPTHCVWGQPHDDPEWTLDAGSKSNNDNEKPLGRICPECFNFYIPNSSSQKICPSCGHEETLLEVNKAQQEYQFNEGNLIELDVDFINQLINERIKIDESPESLRIRMQNAPSMIRASAVNKHVKRQFAQQELRPLIQNWCSGCNDKNPSFTKETIQGEFALQFNINVYKAQVLSERLSNELILKIKQWEHDNE